MSSNVTEVYESHIHYEQQKRWRRIFDAVIDGYRDVLCASPLVASNPDDEVRARRLGPDLIHYKVDIENATRQALKNVVLIKAWGKIVEGVDPVPAAVLAQLVSKCGRIYMARKLTPYDYFRIVKRRATNRRCA